MAYHTPACTIHYPAPYTSLQLTYILFATLHFISHHFPLTLVVIGPLTLVTTLETLAACAACTPCGDKSDIDREA